MTACRSARDVGEAHQILLGALQSAAAGSRIAAAETHGQQHHHQQQQQQQRLQLESFTSNYEHDPDLMASLPAHSLTHLDLQLNIMGEVDCFEDTIAAALAHLINLRELRLACVPEHDCVSGSCLVELTRLTRLTSLTLEGGWSGMEQAMRALLARPPPLQQLRLGLTGQDWALPAADLSRLSQLEELQVGRGVPELAAPAEHASWTLPASLQCLVLRTPISTCRLMHVLNLWQLQDLYLCVGFSDQRLLLRMAERLPALQCVALEYTGLQETVSTAAVWGKLPQLQELILDYRCDHGPSQQQMDTILWHSSSHTAHQAAATGLVEVPGQFRTRSVALSQSLTRLTRLRDLGLCIGPASYLEKGGLLGLHVLTGLTRLVLTGVRVGDVAATMLASNLQQLRHLDLRDCSLEGPCCAALGRLTQLTELNLQDNVGLTRRSVMRLTGLTRLQKFYCDLDENTADPMADWDEPWRVRQQQRW
uniref:Uncharacterized protein n=1 Tax=Tetradesmus obliquus TaxID=3088 RepID=A0A383W7L9_TETOB|eukprot:jgi/Sobl393_1/15825/SZX73628.1